MPAVGSEEADDGFTVEGEQGKRDEEEDLEVPVGSGDVRGGGVSVSCFSHDCKVMLRGGWGLRGV